jgi:hypothetical protein
MKIRNGFVSNSSSSSFVVMLPDNFVDNVDYDEILNNYGEDFPLDDLKNMLTSFVSDGGMWKEEIYNYEGDGDWEFTDILDNMLKPYILAGIDTGPDAGQYVIVTPSEIENKLNEIKKM